MEYIFSQILKMSIQASIVIIFVLLIRYLFQKSNVPEKYVCLLWFIPMIRMVCPVFWESRVSIIPEATTRNYTVPQTIGMTENEIAELVNASGMQITTEVVSSNAENTMSTSSTLSPMFILSVIWIIGISILLIYSIISLIKLQKHLNESIIVKNVNCRNKIYESDKIETPFVYGFISPKIYLPSSIWTSNYEYVIAHEQAHIYRKDHIVKFVGFMITVLHWFNPFAWILFICLGKDMEMACDELVVKQIGIENKAEYAETLLVLAMGESRIIGIPLAFGEGETKGRIKHILKYKKTKGILIALALVIIGVVSAMSLTNPKIDRTENEKHIAEQFWKEVFEISQEEFEQFQEIMIAIDGSAEWQEKYIEEYGDAALVANDIDALAEWQEKYKEYFTEHGYETAVSNRVLIYGVKTRQKGYEVKEILVEEKTSGDEKWYQYRVTVGDEWTEMVYQGNIFFSEAEEGKIESITPTETTENHLLTERSEILFERNGLEVSKYYNGDYDIIMAHIALNGIEFTSHAKEKLLKLEEVRNHTVTLSDGNEINILDSGNEEGLFLGLFSSCAELEDLLDIPLSNNTELQYPENADNFCLQYSDYVGYVYINSANVLKENVEISTYIFFLEDPQKGEHRSNDLMIESELIYEEYVTAQGKKADIFVDSAGERGMLLLTEENISYEWDFMSSEKVIDVDWIREFADNI